MKPNHNQEEKVFLCSGIDFVMTPKMFVLNYEARFTLCSTFRNGKFLEYS